MANILIKHAEIITMNKQEDIIYGDIRIKADLIVEIGTGLEVKGRSLSSTPRTGRLSPASSRHIFISPRRCFAAKGMIWS